VLVTVFNSVVFHKFISKAEESSRIFFDGEKKNVGEVIKKIDFCLDYSVNFCE